MREREERREKKQTLTELREIFTYNENVPKGILFGYKMGGGGGGGKPYIGHPMYENTRKPNILANTRDKEVIHQNEVGWH